MRKYSMTVTLVAALVVTAWSGLALAQNTTGARAVPSSGQSLVPPHESPATTAINQAAQAGKYIFLLFYRADDEATRSARQTLDAAMENFADRAVSTTVDIANPQERALVSKYQLNRSPMPLVMALAPTGAVTRSFTGQFSAAELDAAFVSPGMQKCLKALQDRKMALICVQNGTTQHNAEAMRGVTEFAADAQYAKTTEVITIDPADAAEESLLQQFKVDPKTAEAVTVFVAPPGTTVGTYQGETKKEVLIAAAKTAAKGCTPGSGCCPSSKKSASPPAQPQPAGSTGKKS